ncbi:hypothetical protein EG68_03865 [Paragonimus skrjabini miyazakii]|uniref:Uncharacterized protein n=1 Tax=Paragonimus skrjabini miyazakii TaxID=59628 RepID=A0A8S9Z012_9TREM|nr:hypothetical protein EG68_03865 [Paragonimus skrjabini miyazakii]
MELGQYPVVAVPDSGKIIDRAATTSSLKNPSPIAKHPMTTYASCGIVHVLRCTECGFESIVRDRFDTHSPCAGNIESYLLYTCSRCGGSSTSQTLMNEHAEFCHPDLSFLIEESVQKFRARGTDIDRTCSSSPNKSHKTLQTTPSTSTATHSFHPSSSADPRQSQGHGGSRLTERTMGRSNEALANDSYLNSFLEMINYFGS